MQPIDPNSQLGHVQTQQNFLALTDLFKEFQDYQESILVELVTTRSVDAEVLGRLRGKHIGIQHAASFLLNAATWLNTEQRAKLAEMVKLSPAAKVDEFGRLIPI